MIYYTADLHLSHGESSCGSGVESRMIPPGNASGRIGYVDYLRII